MVTVEARMRDRGRIKNY